MYTSVVVVVEKEEETAGRVLEHKGPVNAWMRLVATIDKGRDSSYLYVFHTRRFEF